MTCMLDASTSIPNSSYEIDLSDQGVQYTVVLPNNFAGSCCEPRDARACMSFAPRRDWSDECEPKC